MPVVINGSSGITDVDGTASAPALTGTDTDTGIFFPAANTMAFSTAGTERMRVDSSGNFQFNSGYGSVATAYGCRAWVNFNGTSTVSIRASGNVSSITDNGTGNYTVNFTTALSDTNGAVNVSGAAGTSPTGLRAYGLSSTLSSSSVTVFSAYISSTGGSSTAEDEPVMCVSVFR